MTHVSVLVLTHGRDRHLLRQAETLLHAQGWDECVVTFVNQDAEPWPTPPPGFRTQHLDADGLALAAARNASASAAHGDLLVFLDVDCLVDDRTLLLLLADCAPGRLAMVDPRYLPPTWEPGDDVHPVALPNPARSGVHPGASLQWHMFWSLGFAITADDFRRVGGFDESYSGYGGEDTDFAFRCRDAGMELWFSRARVFHQAHAVHRPPLQHLDSIVRNAHAFRDRWGTWPMEGWLGAFADMGLVRWTPDELVVLRPATEAELAASHLPDARF